jgi:hypothetical protein
VSGGLSFGKIDEDTTYVWILSRSTPQPINIGGRWDDSKVWSDTALWYD